LSKKIRKSLSNIDKKKTDQNYQNTRNFDSDMHKNVRSNGPYICENNRTISRIQNPSTESNAAQREFSNSGVQCIPQQQLATNRNEMNQNMYVNNTKTMLHISCYACVVNHVARNCSRNQHAMNQNHHLN